MSNEMLWKRELPTKPGFYYWQNQSLRSQHPLAVRVVQVSQYRNRPGFLCETLGADCGGSDHFNCDLDKAPTGVWAGPLPQPYWG